MPDSGRNRRHQGPSWQEPCGIRRRARRPARRSLVSGEQSPFRGTRRRSPAGDSPPGHDGAPSRCRGYAALGASHRFLDGADIGRVAVQALADRFGRDGAAQNNPERPAGRRGVSWSTPLGHHGIVRHAKFADLSLPFARRNDCPWWFDPIAYWTRAVKAWLSTRVRPRSGLRSGGTDA